MMDIITPSHHERSCSSSSSISASSFSSSSAHSRKDHSRSLSSVSCADAVLEKKEENEMKVEESMILDDGAMLISHDAYFFCDTSVAIEKDREARRRKYGTSASYRSPSGTIYLSLDSIAENEEIGNESIALNERRVKITTLIIPHGGTECASFVSKHLHQSITDNYHFTSVSLIPKVLREAFVKTDKMFMDYLSENGIEDESGCSVICSMVSADNTITIAHVGEVRGILAAPSGHVVELSPSHTIGHSLEEYYRLQQLGYRADADDLLFGKYKHSRAFGHKTMKLTHPLCIIAQPYVIQLRKNVEHRDLPEMKEQSDTFGNSWLNKLLPTFASKKINFKEKFLLILGSSSIWESVDDKEMCVTISKTQRKNYSLKKIIEIIKKGGSAHKGVFSKKERHDPSPKGIYGIMWTKESN